VTGIPIRPKG